VKASRIRFFEVNHAAFVLAVFGPPVRRVRREKGEGRREKSEE
jgi:hypothetical protein